jgi:hypothetical protein
MPENLHPFLTRIRAEYRGIEYKLSRVETGRNYPVYCNFESFLCTLVVKECHHIVISSAVRNYNPIYHKNVALKAPAY